MDTHIANRDGMYWQAGEPPFTGPDAKPRLPVELESGRTFYTLQEVEEANARGWRDGHACGMACGLWCGIVGATLVVGASCTWLLHVVGVL